MKRFAAMLIALVMMLTMVPAMADEVTGTAKGFGGDVTVTLTVENGVITAAKAEGADETPAWAPLLWSSCLPRWSPATP